MLAVKAKTSKKLKAPKSNYQLGFRFVFGKVPVQLIIRNRNLASVEFSEAFSFGFGGNSTFAVHSSITRLS